MDVARRTFRAVGRFTRGNRRVPAGNRQANSRPSRSVQQPMRNRRSRLRRRRNLDVLDDVVQTVTSAINKPVVLLLCALTVAFYIDNASANGFIHRICDDKPNSLICRLSISYFSRLCGIIIFLPALYDLPKRIWLFSSVFVIALIIVLPNFPLYAYAIYAFLLHTYFRVKTNTSRYVILFIVALLYILGATGVLPLNSKYCITDHYYTYRSFDHKQNLYTFHYYRNHSQLSGDFNFTLVDPSPPADCCVPLKQSMFTFPAKSKDQLFSMFFSKGPVYRCGDKIYIFE